MATTWRFFQPAAPTAPAAEIDWERLYSEELPRIHNFFRYRVGDEDQAQDLTAVTFEKAWLARARFRRDRAAFATWLYTIARNVAVDFFRSRRENLSLDEVRAELSRSSPADIVERKADLAQLRSLLAELSPREQELIALKHGASLSNREIARLTKLGESNVGTILARATARLRTRWKETNQ